MFARVLTRMPGLEPTVPMAELPWRNSNFITGVESMPVRFTPTEPVGASS